MIRATTVPISLETFCNGMLKELAKEYEVIALSSPGDALETVAVREGVRTIAVPMERHISVFKDLKSLFSLIIVFRVERPGVVHSMTPKAGLLCMMAAWLTRVPVRIHTFTGLVWPTSIGLKRTILRVTDKITCFCATHIIPEGQGVLNDLRNGGITKKPMKVLGYGNVKGIDLKLFSPDNFCRNEHGTFDYLFVGRIVGDKGINELVAAFTKLHDRYSTTRLFLVGEFENNLDPVSELTNSLIKNNGAIVATGAKRGNDLLQMYVDADCFVMPSYREGFPNTVIEAGAMGLPQIVTDINGSREIVTDGKNGLIVPSRNTQALYDAMERVLIDEELRKEFIRNSRPMIESRFEKNFVQGCLIDFYREVILI